MGAQDAGHDFEFMPNLRVLDVHARNWSCPPLMTQDTLLGSARRYIRMNIWHPSWETIFGSDRKVEHITFIFNIHNGMPGGWIADWVG
jgi:hypothetical protein